MYFSASALSLTETILCLNYLMPHELMECDDK